MRWRKLGKIFDPAQHQLPVDSVGFAQSPQALVLDDRVRIYFSTRTQDAPGQYLSHAVFVDFDKRLERVIGVAKHEALPLGGLGCFDEHGIFPFSVFRDANQVRAYTTGWNRKVSVPADAAIGLAISDDNGLTFRRHGTGPVMGAALHEPFLVGDAFVAKYGDTYHMWYIFGVRWTEEAGSLQPERVYKIAHARSADGVEWLRDSKLIVPDRLNQDECQALPTVIELAGSYHMLFCYREARGFRKQSSKSYRLGYAVSEDLAHWRRDDAQAGIDASGDGWDSGMQCYPHLFRVEDRVYLLYNGNEFGRYGFGAAILEQD